MSQSDEPTNRTPEVAEEAWTGAFAAKSGDAFGENFTDDVVLEAGTLLKPVVGREHAAVCMSTASNYYSSLVFTHQAENGPRTYMEWEATGPSGVEFSGVTVLTRNDRGLIEHISISHRPLGAALEFSAEMARRTAGRLPAGHFLPEAE